GAGVEAVRIVLPVHVSGVLAFVPDVCGDGFDCGMHLRVELVVLPLESEYPVLSCGTHGLVDEVVGDHASPSRARGPGPSIAHCRRLQVTVQSPAVSAWSMRSCTALIRASASYKSAFAWFEDAASSTDASRHSSRSASASHHLRHQRSRSASARSR